MFDLVCLQILDAKIKSVIVLSSGLNLVTYFKSDFLSVKTSLSCLRKPFRQTFRQPFRKQFRQPFRKAFRQPFRQPFGQPFS